MKYSHLLFALFCYCTAFSQDPNFIQPQAIPLYTNPSFFQGDSLTKISLANSTAYNFPYSTFAASASTFLAKQDAYVGVIYLNDDFDYGRLIKQRIGADYAQNFRLPQGITLRIGTEIAYETKKLEKNIAGDNIDPRKGFIYNTDPNTSPYKAKYFDWNLGASLYWKRISLGFGWNHVMQPNDSYLTFDMPNNSYLPRKLVYNLSYDGQIPVGKYPLHIIPSVQHLNQGNNTYNQFKLTLTSLLLKYRGVMVGGVTNHNQDNTWLLGYQYKNRFLVSFSHTQAKSKYYNTNELVLTYSFWKRKTAESFSTLEGVYY